VVFEMIRPICASFPRCTPRGPPHRSRARSGKPARIPRHRKQRGSPVECHISRQRRGGREPSERKRTAHTVRRGRKMDGERWSGVTQ